VNLADFEVVNEDGSLELGFIQLPLFQVMHNYFLSGLSRGFLRQFVDQAYLSLIVATALPQA
jgi:hypothetical protein